MSGTTSNSRFLLDCRADDLGVLPKPLPVPPRRGRVFPHDGQGGGPLRAASSSPKSSRGRLIAAPPHQVHARRGDRLWASSIRLICMAQIVHDPIWVRRAGTVVPPRRKVRRVEAPPRLLRRVSRPTPGEWGSHAAESRYCPIPGNSLRPPTSRIPCNIGLAPRLLGCRQITSRKGGVRRNA